MSFTHEMTFYGFGSNRWAPSTQNPLSKIMEASTVMDHPFPRVAIIVGASIGVSPAKVHRIKLEALMTEDAQEEA